jgi:hypothetical protein
LRVWDIRENRPNQEIWLYARKYVDGKQKFFISNAAEDTPIEKFRDLALRRWSIEQCFEECKSDLGMDHYEGRSWRGWHRHILLVFIAHLFLLKLRQEFAVDASQLSEKGQKIFKFLNPCKDDPDKDEPDKDNPNKDRPKSQEKVVILTLGQVKSIFLAVCEADPAKIRKRLEIVSFKIKSYARSFWSWCESGFAKMRALQIKDVKNYSL